MRRTKDAKKIDAEEATGAVLTQVFSKPWQRHYVRLVRVRSINFEGDFLFGKDIDEGNPRYEEMRIEAYGVFDRLKKDHSIEIYIRSDSTYNSTWSEDAFGGNRSTLEFSMPKNIFVILYKNIIESSVNNEFIIVLSVGESVNTDGSIKYACRFESLQILPIFHKTSHESETLVTAVGRIEKVMMWVLYGVAAIGALLLWHR